MSNSDVIALAFTVLQIRRGNRDNLGIISHIFHKNILCDPSLEPSHRDGSNEGSQYMFSLRNKKTFLNYPKYPLLSGALPMFCSDLY